ncbi:MAG: SH3 domain-containing protein [Candidatus Omnitrophica bacterium]|nr:SH3 domain-containing protein [Candidatus Omnitrophota bacterium]MBU4149650.1 SH3 domain-containing protein [Candidatus Omnitrophota bacterium]
MCFIKAFSILIAMSFLLPGACFSQEGYEEKEISKIGFVKNDGANVRAGDNVNFTSLCNLEKGDPVKITGKRYSWYKVILPRKACVYIRKDFVGDVSEKGEAGVIAERVNLRAGADTKYAILGQISKPEKIHIVAEEAGWYKIFPPEGTSGWIHSSQLRFSIEGISPKPEPVDEVVKPGAKKDNGVKLMLKKKNPNGNLTFSTQGKQ